MDNKAFWAMLISIEKEATITFLKNGSDSDAPYYRGVLALSGRLLNIIGWHWWEPNPIPSPDRYVPEMVSLSNFLLRWTVIDNVESDRVAAVFDLPDDFYESPLKCVERLSLAAHYRDVMGCWVEFAKMSEVMRFPMSVTLLFKAGQIAMHRLHEEYGHEPEWDFSEMLELSSKSIDPHTQVTETILEDTYAQLLAAYQRKKLGEQKVH